MYHLYKYTLPTLIIINQHCGRIEEIHLRNEPSLNREAGIEQAGTRRFQ